VRRAIRTSTFFASLLFTVALMLASDSFGQGITGSFTGDVTEASGAYLTGATLSIRQLDTNEVRTVTTSDRGSFSVPQLPPGITVSRSTKVVLKPLSRTTSCLRLTRQSRLMQSSR
jgi:hypothetical protein